MSEDNPNPKNPEDVAQMGDENLDNSQNPGPSLVEKYPKSFSLILSQVTEDISNMTMVTSKPQFQLVPRIHGWKPLPAARIIKASQMKKQKGCVLCEAADDIHSKVWHAYGTAKDVTGAVRAAQDNGVVGVTAKITQNHFSNHNYIQPAPQKRLKLEEMVHLAQKLSKRDKEILLAIYRQRVLSSRQIIDLFFEPNASSEISAQKGAYRTLHKLRFGHFLYQYRLQETKSPEKFYFLGRYGAPWVENEEGKSSTNPYVTGPESINEYFIEHDSLAADIYVQLRKQLYNNRDENLVIVEGVERSLRVALDAWYGPRALACAFHDAHTNTEQKIVPDGFGALDFSDGRHRQFRLPFFYEWDSGSRELDDTARQLSNYVGFAISGAVSKRFPQLEVEGYFPPVLVVTSTPNRAYKLVQATRKAISNYGSELVPEIFITDVETLRRNAYAPGAWHMVKGSDNKEPISIAEHLLLANQPLIEKNPIHLRKEIEIDYEGAKPKSATAF